MCRTEGNKYWQECHRMFSRVKQNAIFTQRWVEMFISKNRKFGYSGDRKPSFVKGTEVLHVQWQKFLG